MIMLKDNVLDDVLKFLDHCEGNYYCYVTRNNIILLAYGRSVLSVVEQPLEQNPIPVGQNTVTYEARLLKSLFLKLCK